MMEKDFSASFWGLLCRKAWIYCPHRVPRTVPFNILQPSPGKESQVPTEIEEWGCWNLLKPVKSLIKSTKSGPEYAILSILQTLSFCEHAHLFGYGSIPISTIFSGLFTSINPSYDLGFTRGTRVPWPIPIFSDRRSARNFDYAALDENSDLDDVVELSRDAEVWPNSTRDGPRP